MKKTFSKSTPEQILEHNNRLNTHSFFQNVVKSNFVYTLCSTKHLVETIHECVILLCDLGYFDISVIGFCKRLEVVSGNDDFVLVKLGDYGNVKFPRNSSFDGVIKQLIYEFELYSL